MCAPNTLVEDSSPSQKNSGSSSFADQTISMSAGRLMATLAAVALSVFFATAHFYADRSASSSTLPKLSATPDAGAVKKGAATQMVPLGNPNHTSQAVAIKRSPTEANQISVAKATAPGQDDVAGGININMGNVASEVGIVIALQAIFPVVNRLIIVAKRVRWASLGVKVTPAVGRVLKTFGDVWHTLMLAYKKTSASKIVTRTKKMVKILKHHDHDDHYDELGHGHDAHHNKKKVHSDHM